MSKNNVSKGIYYLQEVQLMNDYCTFLHFCICMMLSYPLRINNLYHKTLLYFNF